MNQQSLRSKPIALITGPRPKVTSLGYLKIVILVHILCENPHAWWERCLKKISLGAIRKCRFITAYIVRRPHSCYVYRPSRNSWKRFLYARPTPDARTLCEPTLKVLSNRERCYERRDNATNGKYRTLFVLMICSHCRVATRKATIEAIIARIGYVSNLTTHIQIR